MPSVIIDLTYFDVSQGFRIVHGGSGVVPAAGQTVADAGDVNGDGIDDLIVRGNGPTYVVYGTSNATRGTVTLETLTAAQGFAISAGSFSVSAAGDVNDDGIGDLIIGNPGAGLPGGSTPFPGEAYVIYGRSGTRGALNFANSTTLAAADGFAITSSWTGGLTGWSVSAAGDINSDGVDDIILSARDRNEAYVIYGLANSTRGLLNLSSFAASNGFRITLPANNSVWSVSNAGDVNNDGIDDVVIGSPSFGGRAVVVYGRTGTSRGTIDGSNIAASDGFIISGTGSTGRSVSNAGDVNGDGIDDLIVGAFTALGPDPVGPNGGGNASGRAYVIYGQNGSTRGTLNVATLTSSEGFTVQGNTLYGGAGVSVSAAGDVNGDGLADLIVGADNLGGRSGGEAYIVYGLAGTSRTVIDTASLAPSDGFIVQGEQAFFSTGRSVSAAGDINNDGIDDLVVGARGTEVLGVSSTAAYVIYGTATPRAPYVRTAETIDVTALSPTQGFAVIGDAVSDAAGTSVSNAGDVNGDGVDDFIVGIPGSDSGGNNSGQALIVFGRAGATRPSLDLATLSASDGFFIQGNNDDDGAGLTVSAAGDVNGDGLDDLIIGATSLRTGAENAAAYVIFGRSGATRGNIDLTALSVGDGFTVRGQPGSYVGYGTATSAYSVSGAGDINGDGFDDLLIGSPLFDAAGAESGRAYVLFGRGGATRANIDLATLSSSDGFTITGGQSYDYAGQSVSGAGDINGDGFDDIIVSADSSGSIVLFGAAGATRANVNLTSLSATDGFILPVASGNGAQTSVSNAGDINGDGIDDLIVGRPYGLGRGTYDGEAYVIYGRLGATRTVNLNALPIADGFKIQGDASGDAAGFSVTNAGDFNGDGIDDLLISASGNDNGGTNAGAAYVIFGRAGATRTTIDLTRLSRTDGMAIVGDAARDAAGRSVSAAGDINDDGIADLIVGAPGNDVGGSNAGAAYVIFGSRFYGIAPIDGTALGEALNGTAGIDIINGLGGNDTLDGGLSADRLIGGGGDDIYIIDNLGDVVVELANDGTDEVRTSVVGYTLPDNVETIIYTGAGPANLLGNSGNNSIALGNTGGVLNFSQGGNDTGTGGDGQDGFYFGGAFDANDQVNGGAGRLDQVALQGSYAAGVTLGANSAVGVEQFVLLPGSDTRFGVTGNPTLAYNIITGDAAIGAGQRLIFQANTLRAGESFALDASGELDGSVFTYGGLGTENLRGSQNADSFFFGTGRFNASDVVDGQGGVDQLGLQGTYSGANAITFGAGQLLNIEMIVCLSNNDSRFGGAGSGTPYSYSLTMNDANVAAGATLTISANNLASDETLTFDGSAELDGRYTIFSGNGADSIIGGALGDTISGRGGADNLTGGGGNDIFLYTNLTDSIATAQDHILDFTSGDVIDLGRLDAITGGANNAFAFIGDAAFGNTAGQLRAVNTSGNDWLVEADVNGDGIADLSILVTTSDADPLTAGDFVL